MSVGDLTGFWRKPKRTFTRGAGNFEISNTNSQDYISEVLTLYTMFLFENYYELDRAEIGRSNLATSSITHGTDVISKGESFQSTGRTLTNRKVCTFLGLTCHVIGAENSLVVQPENRNKWDQMVEAIKVAN